jgi:hypothetical protein
VLWLASRPWWLLAGAFVLLLLGLVLYISVLSIIPVVLVLFLLFFSGLMALKSRRGTPRPPDPN